MKKRMIDQKKAFKELTMAMTRLNNLKNDADLPDHLKSTVEAIRINVEDAISELPSIMKREAA